MDEAPERRRRDGDYVLPLEFHAVSGRLDVLRQLISYSGAQSRPDHDFCECHDDSLVQVQHHPCELDLTLRTDT